MKNKDYLRLLIYFVIFITIGILVNIFLYKEHQKELYIINNQILSVIVKKHPELKDELVASLLNGNYETEEVLKEYGIMDYSDIEKLSNFNQYKSKLLTYNFGYFFAILTFTILIYLANNYKYKKEFRKTNEYMNSVLNGNYNLDIRDYDENEFSLLKNDIYKLVVKLKEGAEAERAYRIYLKDFLSDVSHQLKTPLTSMYVINDILSVEKDDKKRKEFILKNKHQLERIEWLITSLLKMSLLESETIKLKKENVNIQELIIKAIEPIKIPIELKNINLNIKGDENTTFALDSKWTGEALLNIIKNSFEHTYETGNVSIYFVRNPLYLMIKISDDGSGIKQSEIKKIFTRFYKSTNSNGVGIGLNMSKKIIEMQNGEIIVRSIEGKGTTFEIRLYSTNV